MEIKKRALGKGLEQLFNNENLDLDSFEKSVYESATKEEIIELFYKNVKKYDYVFVEAALLIEDHYDVICDELWYIYADETVRRNRLKESRNYTDEKIDDVISNQLSEDEFRKACQETIDNSYEFEYTK